MDSPSNDDDDYETQPEVDDGYENPPEVTPLPPPSPRTLYPGPEPPDVRDHASNTLAEPPE